MVSIMFPVLPSKTFHQAADKLQLVINCCPNCTLWDVLHSSHQAILRLLTNRPDQIPNAEAVPQPAVWRLDLEPVSSYCAALKIDHRLSTAKLL